MQAKIVQAKKNPLEKYNPDQECHSILAIVHTALIHLNTITLKFEFDDVCHQTQVEVLPSFSCAITLLGHVKLGGDLEDGAVNLSL